MRISDWSSDVCSSDLPGGTVDLVSRLIAKGLSEDLKQSVIVENKPGASGLIGTRDVAHAEPDGYTLLAVANTFVSAPAFVPNAGYDPLRSEEHTSELQSLMRISYAVFCLKKKN